jgi:hypothetical protein
MSTQSEQIELLAAALVKAQGDLRNPPKDNINPHFKSRYSDLATVRETVVPVLAQHGLAVSQVLANLNGSPALTTLLVHTSGQWISGTVPLLVPKGSMQDLGSAVTYARRYGLLAITGTVGDDDDDGNAASQPPKPQVKIARPQQSAQPKPVVQSPQAKPAFPAPAPKLGVPELLREMERTGISWQRCFDAMNNQLPEDYRYDGFRNYEDCEPSDIANIVLSLRKQPDRRRDEPPATVETIDDIPF